MKNAANASDAKIRNHTSFFQTYSTLHIDIFLLGILISIPIDSEENGLEKSTTLFLA